MLLFPLNLDKINLYLFFFNDNVLHNKVGNNEFHAINNKMIQKNLYD